MTGTDLTIEKLESQIVELKRLALAKMNARYDEFEQFDADYPDGCIGDPESLVNENRVTVLQEVLRLIRGGI